METALKRRVWIQNEDESTAKSFHVIKKPSQRNTEHSKTCQSPSLDFEQTLTTILPKALWVTLTRAGLLGIISRYKHFGWKALFQDRSLSASPLPITCLKWQLHQEISSATQIAALALE